MSVRSAAAHLVNASLVEDTLGITSGVLHSVADLVEVGGARRSGCEYRRAHVVDELGEEDLVADRRHRVLDRDLGYLAEAGGGEQRRQLRSMVGSPPRARMVAQ